MPVHEEINGSAGCLPGLGRIEILLSCMSRDIWKGTCLTLLVSKARLTAKDRDPKCGILAPTCCPQTPNHTTSPGKQARQITIQIHVESTFIDILTAFSSFRTFCRGNRSISLPSSSSPPPTAQPWRHPSVFYFSFLGGPTSRTSAVERLFRSA